MMRVQKGACANFFTNQHGFDDIHLRWIQVTTIAVKFIYFFCSFGTEIHFNFDLYTVHHSSLLDFSFGWWSMKLKQLFFFNYFLSCHLIKIRNDFKRILLYSIIANYILLMPTGKKTMPSLF